MRRNNVSLRLLSSLANELKSLSEEEGVSVNQYINVAVAEKLASQRTAEAFFAGKIKQSTPGGMLTILEMAGNDEPEPTCNEIIDHPSTP